MSMGLSLLFGTVVAGILLPLGLTEFFVSIIQGVFDPITIQLVIAVALISGLGHIMKETRDLELLIDSLISIFRNSKFLCMFLPMLIGSLNVPGGAIISAPMVDESGSKLKLDPVTKTTINLFFRHIGFFVYPLYSSLIIASELFGVHKLTIVRYNFFVMLVGLGTAYFVLFRGIASQNQEQKNDDPILMNVKSFLFGFSPIIVALGLVLLFDLPFYLGISLGVAVALLRRLPTNSKQATLKSRVRQLFSTWVDYKLVFIVIGIMSFKAVIESSGVVQTIAESLTNYGIPLPLMILGLGIFVAYITGVHMAATGLLAALFAPMIPVIAPGPYISLLFTSIIVGYLISPLHLCLVLSNQHFDVNIWPVYRKLALPLSAMLLAALAQVMIAL